MGPDLLAQRYGRRQLGSGVMGTGAALLRRRLDALEQRLAVLALGAAGCPTCRGWAAYPVVEDGDAAAGAPGSSILARYGVGPLRGGWPETFVCPSCGREPLEIFRIVYEAAPGGWTTAGGLDP